MKELANVLELNNTIELGNAVELNNTRDLIGNPLLDLINKYGVPALLFDNSQVFTDSAGTTPAGIGDVVGKEADQSGGGHDATQSTTAAKSILRAGRVIERDGIDDFAAGVNPFIGDEFTLIWCGKYRSAPASNKTFFSFGDSLDGANYATFFANPSGDLQAFMTGSLASGPDFSVTRPAVVPVTTKSVVSVRGKTGVQELSQNQTRTATAVETSPVLGNIDIFALGCLLRTSAAGFANVDQDYFFTINKYLTTEELELAEAYVVDLCGVTL